MTTKWMKDDDELEVWPKVRDSIQGLRIPPESQNVTCFTVYDARALTKGHKLFFHLEIFSLQQVTLRNCVWKSLRVNSQESDDDDDDDDFP